MLIDSSWLPRPATTTAPYALVVLNGHYSSDAALGRLRSGARFCVCGDGGANILHSFASARTSGSHDLFSLRPPDAIVGDFDSIDPTVRESYARDGVEISELSDQDSTDFEKCLGRVHAWCSDAAVGAVPAAELIVCAVGAFGDRLDHEFAAINVLHGDSASRFKRVLLLSEAASACVLPAGRSVIRPDAALEGPTCGLLPVGGPCVCSTSGLRWDLSSTPMRFGGLVSRSRRSAARAATRVTRLGCE